MKKIFYYIGSFLLITLSSCNRTETTPDEFFSATINGEKFQAPYLYAIRQHNEHYRSIELYASNIDVLDSAFSYGELESNDNFKLFNFSFRQDCITEKVFNWDDINTDTACVGCIYEFFDSEIKAILPQFLHSDGFIEIESFDYEENGIITGSFEIIGRNYNQDVFTDTIYIKDGRFKIRFNN